jgi:aminoglycoside phosphotransferase (APT) family kinase protein
METLAPIAHHFTQDSVLNKSEKIERGHINRTYLSVVTHHGQTIRLIHQHINKSIFPNPPRMMDNIKAVLDHLESKNGSGDKSLKIVPSDTGTLYYKDDEGEFWRCYEFVENSVTFDIVPNTDIAYKAAHRFGLFLRDLADLQIADFHITIPNFHNTSFRLQSLDKALSDPVVGRLDLARAEVDYVNQNRSIATKLMDVIEANPEVVRIVHNDTKVNNVLFDEHTLDATTVIDLDTVMPGTVLFDIGDLIRTACNTAAEDERDLTKVNFDQGKFAAIIRGFAETTGPSIHPAEWEAMPYCGAVITMTIGIRFLTDFLNGDTYFAVHRENHNLDRCRTQFELARQMLAQIDELKAIVQTERAKLG